MDATNIPQPDEGAILRHLTHIHGIGGIPFDCRLALAFANTSTGALENGRLYNTDDLEQAAADAADINATKGASGYYVPSLVTPDASRRPSDRHFLGTWWLWGDLDAAEAVKQARTRWEQAPPTLVVVTGRIPYTRIQALWRLTVMVEDADYVRAMLGGICEVLQGDPKVANPTSLMRLAGTVAWPWKAGRDTERTFISPHSETAAEYDPETLEAAFPPIAVRHGHSAPRTHQPRTGLGFSDAKRNAEGKIVDGRHDATVNMIFRHFLAWCGENGSAPTTDELFDAMWPEYEATIDMDRPGNAGEEYVKRECAYTVRRFERGQLPGVPDLETAAQRDLEWRQQQAANEAPEKRIQSAQGGRFKLWADTDFEDLPPPEFLIDDWILKEGITLLWGPPGVKKSFVVLDMSLCIAGGHAWCGREIDHPGDVVYFAAEGFQGIAGQRVKAWQKLHRRQPTGRFWLVGDGLRFPRDVGDMVRDIEAAGITPRLIVLDTLSKTLEGKENEDDTMRAFTQGADALAQSFGCQVVVVHHSGKDEDRGPRGSSTLHGDWDVSLRVKRKGEDTITLLHHKAKDFEEVAIDLTTVKVDLGERVTTKADGTEKRRPMSSLVVVPVEGGPRNADADKAPEPKLGKNQSAVLRAITRCHERRAKWTSLYAMTGIEKGNFNRALRALCASGHIRKTTTEDGEEWYELDD